MKHMRHITAFTVILTLAESQAQANCPPPFTTMFACDIMGRQARVEFCADTATADTGVARYSYNFTSGLGPAELYFETDGYYGSSKYMVDGIPHNTLGSGLMNGDTVYSFFVTGYETRDVESAQIHVYNSLADFQENPESDIQRLYCVPGTVLIDWDGTGPG